MYVLVLVFFATTLLQAQSGFVTKIGGSSEDLCAGIAKDPAGNYYVTGTTKSVDFPATTLFTKRFDSTIFRIEGQTSTPIPPPAGDGLAVLAADSSKPGTLVAVFGLDTFKTADGGEHWQALDLHFGNNDFPSVAIDSKSIYFFGTAKGLVRSDDGGATWTTVGPGPKLPDSYTLARLQADPFRAGALVLVSGQTVFRSFDGGVTWQTLSQPLSSFAFDAGRKDVVFGSNQRDIFKSSDGGQTWTKVTAPDPSVAAFVFLLAADPSKPGTVYAALENGFWKSQDDGATWTVETRSTGFAVVIDPKTSTVYLSTSSGVIRNSDGYKSAVGPAFQTSLLVLSQNADPSKPARLFEGSGVSVDGFVAKLDSKGNILWATILGGLADDIPVGIAADASGVYIAGNTSSRDFPGRTATAIGTLPVPFVTKIAADGSRIVYSRVFETIPGETGGVFQRPSAGIAIDSTGAAYLAVTPETQHSILFPSPNPQAANPQIAAEPRLPPIIVGVPTVLKLSPDGASIVYTTGIGNGIANAVAVNPQGEAYIVAGYQVWKLDSSGKAVSDKPFQVQTANFSAAAISPSGDLLLTGTIFSGAAFPTTPNAFQSNPSRFYTPLTGDFTTGDSSDALAMRVSADLSTTLASTRLSGEAADTGVAVAADSKGNLVVAGQTASFGFPTRAPLQGLYNRNTGFISKVAPDATQVLFSTFAGDSRPFQAKGVAVDLKDNPVIAGNTIRINTSPINEPVGDADVFVAVMSPDDLAAPRLDAVLNPASLLGQSVAPSEVVSLPGSGFGTDRGRVLMDGEAIEIVSWSDKQITARTPGTVAAVGDNRTEVRFEVEAGGRLSNPVTMPIHSSSPAIFTASSAGLGQGLIFNQDGTRNSPDNPAAVGSIVSIVASGIGRLKAVGGSVVPEMPLNVYIGLIYSIGVDANLIDVPGFSEKQFAVKVVVPSPVIPGNPYFTWPSSGIVGVVIAEGVAAAYNTNGPISQGGVSIAVKQ